MIDKRRGGSSGDESDSRQMHLDWIAVKSTSPEQLPVESAGESLVASPVESPAEGIIGPRTQSTASSSAPLPLPTANHQPVMRLRWDFRTLFPQVLPEVVDAGLMAAEDTSPQSVEAIHIEHGHKMLGALAELDAAKNERRVTAAKGKHRTSDRIDKPTRLERWYASLLGVYEEWFGREAAEAFDRAVRAWHAHIEVVVDRDAATSSDATLIPSIAQPRWESHDSPAAVNELEPCVPRQLLIPQTRRLSDLTRQRIIARMPVPKPLPAAVAAGHFGTDDRGDAINPSADEVFAITDDHAEKLIDLIRSLPAPGHSGRASIEDQITAGIAKFAEDFGEHAAQRLEAYCRRQARQRDQAWSPRGR